MAAPSTFVAVRSLYRNLHRAIGHLPKKWEQSEGREELRETFDATPLPPSSDGLRELLENGHKRLAFLRMQTGGQRGSYRVRYDRNEAGEVEKDMDPRQGPVTGEKARWSNWGAGNMDPDMVAKHKATLHRARFRDNDHAKGVF